jgi:muconolactone D-isomerase
VLYAVRMDVALPHGMDPDVRTDTLARERTYCRDLQRAGEWVSIWRCVGQYSNLSIFDVADNERLHEKLWNLPLFPYMTIEITPLAQHPSDLVAH